MVRMLFISEGRNTVCVQEQTISALRKCVKVLNSPRNTALRYLLQRTFMLTMKMSQGLKNICVTYMKLALLLLSLLIRSL
ncbi:hypothetical protein D3C78_1023310 [compost metagenome]